MRALEVVIGGLLLVSGTTVPALDVLDTSPANRSVEGEVAFEMANYTGPAQVQASDGAVWSEGSLEMLLQADEVTVQRWEWTGAQGHASLGDPPKVTAHAGQGTVERTTRTFEDATVEIDTDRDGLLSAWPNATRGPSTFSLALDSDDSPPIVASPTGTVLWLRWAGFNHHVEGPLVALEHQGAETRDAWAEPAGFERLEAAGGWDLNVLGGTVTVDGQDRDHTYEPGRDSVQQDAELASVTGTTKRVHALVSVSNATLTTTFGQAESLLLAEDPTWSLNGSLRFDARDGQVRTGLENTSVADDTVTLLGNTTLELQPRGEPQDPGHPQPYEGEGRPTPEIQAQLSSQADSLSVDGQAVSVPEEPAIPEEVTFWGQLLGLVLLVFSVLKKLPPFLLGLLAKDPLNNARRKRIYEFLEEAGMAHPRLISRALGIPLSSASYHLRVLLEADLLTRVEREGYTVYFPCTEFSLEEKQRLALLAGPTRKEIAEVLNQRGGCTQTELADALGVARSTVTRQLGKLAEAGLVEGDSNGPVEYGPSRLLASWFSTQESSPD